MSDFTPGPWTVKSAIESQYIEDKAKCGGTNAILIMAEDDCGHHPIADASCNHSCREAYEQEANARLIAAAPDLLVALQTIISACERCDKDDDKSLIDEFSEEMEAAARAAIAKALGQEA